MFENMIQAIQGSQEPAAGGGAMTPDAMQKLMLAQFLMGGGAAMAQAGARGGRGSYGRSLAAGMAGGMQASGDVFDLLLKQQMHVNDIKREDKYRSGMLDLKKEELKTENDRWLAKVQLEQGNRQTENELLAKSLSDKLAMDEKQLQQSRRELTARIFSDMQNRTLKGDEIKVRALSNPMAMFMKQPGETEEAYQARMAVSME